MPTINELASATTLNGDDKLPLFSTSDGDARKASLTLLSQFFQQQLAGYGFQTQRVAPSTAAFTVDVTPTIAGSNVWLLYKAAAVLASGTIKLPVSGELIDGQEFMLTATQALTAVTFNGNGATVINPPASLAANGTYRFKFDLIDNTWYRIS